jgi:ADP-heptose:LPS heptosyltransferase
MVKILVIQLSRFGDLLQTTPMLRALRRRYPQASITVLARYNVIEIYKDNPDVDYVELFHIEAYTKKLMESPDDIYRSYVELRDAVLRLKTMKFDLIINTTHDRFSTFLAYLLESPEIKGMYLSAQKRLRILVHGFWFRYLRCAPEFRKNASFNLVDIYKNAVGGDISTRDLFFYTPGDALLAAEDLLNQNDINNKTNNLIGFQIGTSTGNRRWPLECFAALGNMLHQDKGVRVVLLGSKDEKGMGEKVAGLMEVKPIDLIGKTALSVLAAVLKKCALLVTNDTGTMHLAEAVGTRCVALFFESANPFQTGPYGAGHIIFSPDLDCFPCPTTFRCMEKKCLDAINVDIVYQLIQYKLNKDKTQTIHSPEGTRIYETRFSQTGIWNTWPINNSRMDKNEFIRMAYRSIWLKYDQQMGEGLFTEKDGELQTILIEEFKEWASRYSIEKPSVEAWLNDFGNGLDILEEKIDKGMSLLEEINTSITSGPFNGSAVTTRSTEVGLFDQQIIQLGKSNSWISQLTSLFELELEQIQDNNFFIMLQAWQQTYEELRLRVDWVRKEIQEIGEVLTKV